MFDLPKLKSLEPAEAILQQQAKINTAINAEVAKIPDLVLGRMAAERALGAAEIEGEAAAVKKARAVLSERQSEIDGVTGKLARLRGALAALGSELGAHHQALAAELPEYNAHIRAQFEEAWRRAAAEFSHVMATRAAIEAVVGPMDLIEPAAGEPVTLSPELIRPKVTLDALLEAVNELVAIRRSALRAASGVVTPGAMLRPFDPHAVYVLRVPRWGLPEGAIVIEASLPEGALRQAVEVGSAVRYVSPEMLHGLRDAERLVQRIAADNAEAGRRESEAEAKQKVLDHRAAVGKQTGEDPYPNLPKVDHKFVYPRENSFMDKLVGDVDAAAMERFGPRVNPD